MGGQKITALDVQREFRTQLARVQEQNPDLTRDQALAAGLGDQVAYTLTVQALIAAEAERLGMVAPIDVVRSYVERIPALQNPETGKFDANRLGLLLQQQQLTQLTKKMCWLPKYNCLQQFLPFFEILPYHLH